MTHESDYTAFDIVCGFLFAALLIGTVWLFLAAIVNQPEKAQTSLSERFIEENRIMEALATRTPDKGVSEGFSANE